ncbi:aminotransferase class I/II-fold pyridoxal phosphate-dependent enzyme [Pleomorphochaeta sp. DL1XJH-081]|uniref:aminotransferase class I/II-fold pyridoxal phosphate-dependent enzyme n=1 Tax=Pleomorphochaeta sp. DL1XJH-081 TaxID=3409690 RepID=UPI003BB4FAF0
MQAMILAAGMGKRLKELTTETTKCMVEVNGITLIERAVRILDSKSLSRIILVVGYKGNLLVDFINTLNIKTPIQIVENSVYDSTNNIYSLFLARKYLLEEDTLLLESDLIFEKAVIDRLLQDSYPNLALVAKYESWMDGTVLTIDDQNNITDFLNKKQFKFCDKENYYKTVNIYKFSKRFSSSHYVPFLEAYCKALGNNEYYEQVLKVISILENPEIKVKILDDEKWYEIDDKQDLDIAESIFTDSSHQKYEKLMRRYGGYWRYPKLIDFCYLVNPHYPPVRLVDEVQANFNRLLRDYPSGQEINALLASNYFAIPQDMTIVGNGAAEIIRAITGLLQDPVGIISPTFQEYPNRLPKNDIIYFHTNEFDYQYTAEDLIKYYSDRQIRTLILVNPDNPSGNLIELEGMLKILDWTSNNNIRLIVDESFMDFSDYPETMSIISRDLMEQNKNLVLIKSISKSYGVPGLRLGVAFSSDRKLIAKLKKDVSIWNINSFAEFYLQVWEKYRADYTNALNQFRVIRSSFFKELDSIPFIRPLPSQANYIMCEVFHPFTAESLAEALLEKNLLIKSLTGKQGIEGQFIRIAIKTESENVDLSNTLKSFAEK